MIVSDEKLTKALHYLAETDEPFAKAKGLLVGLEGQEKTVLSIELLKHEGTIPVKEARARTSEAYREWQKKIEDATYDFELMKNKRNTAVALVEVWKTERYSMRKGNI
jgi:hypothetical protein